MDELKGHLEKQTVPEESTSKVQRLSTQTKGLVEDLRTWVDLKMQFTQLDIEDRIDQKVNEAAKGAVIASVAVVTLVFVLVTVALGLGVLFESYFVGFLCVTTTLILLLIIAAVVKPRLIKVDFFDKAPLSQRKKRTKLK